MKQAYQAPTLKAWGKVADLTLTGCTRLGDDVKYGSIGHSRAKDRGRGTCKHPR
jgi:hypothetical protein